MNIFVNNCISTVGKDHKGPNNQINNTVKTLSYHIPII